MAQKKSKWAYLPGITMARRIAWGSFLDHFCTSSSILESFVGFMAHKHPFLWLPLPDGFSIFSKHLFRLKLWRTEFFHPFGAVLKYGKCSLQEWNHEYQLKRGDSCQLTTWNCKFLTLASCHLRSFLGPVQLSRNMSTLAWGKFSLRGSAEGFCLALQVGTGWLPGWQ